MIKKLYLYLITALTAYSFVVSMEDPRPNNSFVHQNQHIWETDSIKTEVGNIKDIRYNCFGNKILVIGQNCNFAQIWDTTTKKLIAKLEGHTDEILCCAFHPTKDIVVTGGKDNKAIIWDASNGKKLIERNIHRAYNRAFNGGAVTAVAFSPDGSLLLAGTGKGKAFLWKSTEPEDLRKWTHQATLFMHGKDAPVTCVGFDNTNNIAYMATEEGSFYAYYLKNNEWTPMQTPLYKKAIDSCKISFDNKFIALIFRPTADSIKDYKIINLLPPSNTHTYDCKIIDKEKRLFSENNLLSSSFAGFNPKFDEFIEIQGNIAAIYKINRKNIIEQYILEHDSDSLVINAVYDSLGQKIATTSHNLAKIWVKYQNWCCDDHITCDYIIGQILFSPQDNNTLITTSLDSDIITIWKTKGLNPELDKNLDQMEQATSVTENNKKRDRQENTKIISKAPIQKKRKAVGTIINNDNVTVIENINQNTQNAQVLAQDVIPNTSNNQNSQQPAIESEEVEQELKTLELMYDLISSDQEIFEKSVGQVIALHTLDIVKKYLELQKNNINTLDDLDESGQAPVHIAIHNQKLDVLKFLLMCKANINTKNSAGFTLLHIAIEQDNEELAKYLIDNGADINAQTLDNTTPLHIAVKNKSLNIIKMLLDAKANVYIKDSNSLTVLSMVIQSKDIALIRIFGQILFKK